MRREEFAAKAARALRQLCAKCETSNDRNVPLVAVGALIVGMLLSVTLLAAAESRTPIEKEVETVLTPASFRTDDAQSHDDQPAAMPSADAPGAFSDKTEYGDDVRWFNNRPIRPVKTIQMTVTAYSPDERSCGKWADGFTASGYSVWTNGMKLVAADNALLPLGSLVSVPGYDSGEVVPVLDRGGAIKGNRLDVLYPTHERALVWGVQDLEVTVWEYADGKPNDFRQQHHRR